MEDLLQDSTPILDFAPNSSMTTTVKGPIPGFIHKLYRILSDPKNASLIHWNTLGTSFTVARVDEFARKVLPTYFKHNNFSSFVRQLNMYGFHKMQLQGGNGTNSNGDMEFACEHFLRDFPDQLALIKRKTTRSEHHDENDENHRSLSPSSGNDSPIAKLQEECKLLQAQQAAILHQLAALQMDSQRMYSEVITARERSSQQQSIIDRIIRFLASVYQPTNGNTTTPNLGNLSMQQSMVEFLSSPLIQGAVKTNPLVDLSLMEGALVPRKRPLLIGPTKEEDSHPILYDPIWSDLPAKISETSAAIGDFQERLYDEFLLDDYHNSDDEHTNDDGSNNVNTKQRDA